MGLLGTAIRARVSCDRLFDGPHPDHKNNVTQRAKARADEAPSGLFPLCGLRHELCGSAFKPGPPVVAKNAVGASKANFLRVPASVS